jgi:hypothetical protein
LNRWAFLRSSQRSLWHSSVTYRLGYSRGYRRARETPYGQAVTRQTHARTGSDEPPSVSGPYAATPRGRYAAVRYKRSNAIEDGRPSAFGYATYRLRAKTVLLIAIA